VPGEQRRRWHAEGAPASTGKQSTECSEERTIRRCKRLALDLSSADGHFVAQCEELDLLNIVGAGQENHQLEHMADGKVDEGP
jgi:hypothetical protein